MNAGRMVSSLLLVALAASVEAEVAATALEALATRAEQVVLGRVIAVHTLAGHEVAEIEVLRVLRGAADLERVYVHAQPTWTCDTSEAEVGETALFLLAKGNELKAGRAFWRALDRQRRGAPFFLIEWSGRGRMPVRLVDGVEFVTLWTGDVRLPAGIETIPGPEPEYAAFIRSARLDDVFATIESALAPVTAR